MEISAEGIALIKRFEGLVLETYDDGVGIQTVGYGHTGRFRGFLTVGEAVAANGGQPIEITEAEAEELLFDDLQEFENAVNQGIKVQTAQSMFDAFVSLSFNIGANAFQGSTALKRHNKKNYTGAAEAITWWNKAGGQVLAGLVRRRAAEEALYLSGLDEVEDNFNDAPAGQVEENSPRRSNPLNSRTTAGAATSGAAGAGAAGAVLMDDEDGDEVEPSVQTDAPEMGDNDTDGSEVANEEDAPTNDNEQIEDLNDDMNEAPSDTEDTVGEEASDEPDLTEGTEDDGGVLMEKFTQEDKTDAIVIILGAIAVLAALWVIFARLDDWFNHRR